MRYSNVLPGMHFGAQDESASSVLKIMYSIVALWFITSFISGAMNVFYQPGAPPVSVGIFFLVPIAGFTLAYALSSRMRHALDQIPLWFITIAHVWRFVGIGFVIGAVVGVLPPQFGYPEGLGDALAALLCLPLAFAIRRNIPSPRLRAAFVAWNIYGLIDLLSAISMGILYSSSSFGVLRTGLSTELMSTFPVHLIPTFFVPLFVLLHMLSLARSKELAGAADETIADHND